VIDSPTPPPPALHAHRPDRFLVIVAHPDDAEFGPAATAARWIDAGSVAELVCCTSGEAGGDDPGLDPLDLAARREAEERAAAAVVGYRAVHFLHQPDGALENDLPLREQLVRIIRVLRPDAVLTFDPTQLFLRGHVQHTDHRAAGMAAVDATYPAAQNPMAFPALARGGLAAHKVDRLYLFWTAEPDTFVDASGYVERKIAALMAHQSQLRDPADVEARVRGWLAEEGARVGIAAAEAFRLISRT
jgi:LmbE family N-acetylglucosaminyl deacetylase